MSDERWKCNNCDSVVNGEYKFCVQCGSERGSLNLCHACGIELQPRWDYCGRCGVETPFVRRNTNQPEFEEIVKAVDGIRGNITDKLGKGVRYLSDNPDAISDQVEDLVLKLKTRLKNEKK